MTTAIPKQNELVYPVLKALQGLGGEASNDEIDKAVIDLLGLPKEILDLQYEESEDWIVKNRINFARSYAKKAGLLKNPKRSFWSLTEPAEDLLKQPEKKARIKAQELHSEASKVFAEETKQRKLKKNNEISRFGLYLPVLQFLSTQTEPVHAKLVIEELIQQLEITEENKKRTNKSGNKIIDGDIRFALGYLRDGGALNRPKPAVYEITEFGRALLAMQEDQIISLVSAQGAQLYLPGGERWNKEKRSDSSWLTIIHILRVIKQDPRPSMGVWTIVRIVNNRFTLSNPFIDEAEGSEEKAINEIRWGISIAENIGALDIIANKGGRSLTAFGEKILEMEEAEAIELLRDLNTSQKNISSLGSVLSLGEDLLFDPTEFFVEVEELLEDRPQAIFYGPPGTGKTWAALQLAEVLAGDESRTRLVQFHPSYAYEDFIEGWRPTEDGSFNITDGPLKRMAADAAANPDGTFVLVIDEINRANLSKVLGELFFLLEYRDRSITLQYSDTEFQLPENLKIIGTMNTADRSIALVDAALRRRFHFHGFFPDREPIQGLLRRWLDAQGKTDLLWVADLIDAANNKLDERDLAIGPSHFMKADLDEDKVQKIWKRSIMPYIEDHYFDDPDQATEFTYDQLRNNTQP